jgi:hypothetical protein
VRQKPTYTLSLLHKGIYVTHLPASTRNYPPRSSSPSLEEGVVWHSRPRLCAFNIASTRRVRNNGSPGRKARAGDSGQGQALEAATRSQMLKNRIVSYPLLNSESEDGVPRIPDEILDTVVYLYPDRDSAMRGERAGGSGFMVSVPSEAGPDLYYSYVVTNSHVIREAKCDALRVNTRAGGTNVIDSTEEYWIHHP